MQAAGEDSSLGSTKSNRSLFCSCPSGLVQASALAIRYDELVDYTIRKASLGDRAAIEQLIVASARSLSRDDYSEQQIEAAIATVFGVDTNLILDGTYFVADSEGT